MIDIDNYFGTVSEEDYVQQTEEHFKYLESLSKKEENHARNKILAEVIEQLDRCDELFNIAWKLNEDENTRTAFSQKVTTYMPSMIQTLSFIIDEAFLDEYLS